MEGECLDITKGRMAMELQHWGQIFSIEFFIFVSQWPKNWMNVVHFAGTDKSGPRIPGVWIYKNKHLYVWSMVNDNNKNHNKFKLELETWYHVVIQQIKDVDNRYWFEIIIDGESKWKLENLIPKTFSTINFYTSSPWYDSFTYEFGWVCYVKLQHGGNFLIINLYNQIKIICLTYLIFRTSKVS